MSILDDWRAEAQMRHRRVDLWWRRLAVLLFMCSGGVMVLAVLWARALMIRWVW
jgi:hypothetical protein